MKKIIAFIKRFSNGIVNYNISAHAAASAFYMFLSLVPFFAALTALIPLTGYSSTAVLELIGEYIPKELMSLIGDIVGDIYYAADAVLPVSIVISLWLASRAFSSLIRGIENITDTPHYASFFKRSLRALLYTAVVILMLIILPTLLAFSGKIAELISFSKVLSFMHKLRFILVIVILTLLFTAIYHWTPNMKLKISQLLPGAAAAAVVWYVFSWLFSFFIRYGSSYSIYGSLAAIVISLLWMYWCMFIVLLGAYLDTFIYRKRAGEDNIIQQI